MNKIKMLIFYIGVAGCIFFAYNSVGNMQLAIISTRGMMNDKNKENSDDKKDNTIIDKEVINDSTKASVDIGAQIPNFFLQILKEMK